MIYGKITRVVQEDKIAKLFVKTTSEGTKVISLNNDEYERIVDNHGKTLWGEEAEISQFKSKGKLRTRIKFFD